MLDMVSALLVLLGLASFVSGTAGLLRFPDTHSRLHALTKADNLGLGLLALGLAVYADSAAAVLKLFLIWALAIVAAAAAAQLVARSALEESAGPASTDAP